MIRSVVLVFVCWMTFLGSANSQTIGYAEATDMLAAACGKDIESLCGGVNLGGGRLKSCMTRNSARVSQNCKDTCLLYTSPSPRD